MKSKYSHLIPVLCFVFGLNIISEQGIAQDAVSEDTVKFQLGASINPVLIVLSGGGYLNSPALSLQGKLIGEKFTPRFEVQYKPDQSSFPFSNRQYYDQTDTTVRYYLTNQSDEQLQFLIGGEVPISTGKVEFYAGTDVFMTVFFNSFILNTEIVSADSSYIVDLGKPLYTDREVNFGGGVRPFIGLRANVSKHVSLSTEFAPIMYYATLPSYTVGDDLSVTKSRFSTFNFESLPLINFRIHYNFY